MMSAAPNLAAPAPGTPATEWADKVISEAERPAPHGEQSMPSVGTAQQAFAGPAGQTTPGFPGGWNGTPTTENPPTSTSDPASTAQAIAQDVSQQASATAQYALAAAQDTFGKAAQTAASYLPTNVAETIGQYVPAAAPVTAQASANDVPHTASYPSKELAGHIPGEHVEGAGALPGLVTESGVTKLPEEETRTGTIGGQAQLGLSAASATAISAAEAAYAAVQSGKETVASTVGSSTGGSTAVTAVGPATNGTTAVTTHPVMTLPSEEGSLVPGEKVGGVGALPGASHEAGVAMLPDEKLPPPVSLPTREAEPVAGEFVGGVGSLPGASHEAGVAQLPDERVGGESKPEAIKEKVEAKIPGTAEHKEAKAASSGTANEAHDAKPVGEKPHDEVKPAGEKEPAPIATGLGTGAQTTEQGRQPTPSPTSSKPKFMDKLKGESKILLGKLSGKKDKVEEGQKVKSGTA